MADIQKCTYCRRDKETFDVHTIEGVGTTFICKGCDGEVVSINISSLELTQNYENGQIANKYDGINNLIEFTKAYLKDQDIEQTDRYKYLDEVGKLDLLVQDKKIIDHLKRDPIESWLPIRMKLMPQIEFGKDIFIKSVCFDGLHRIAMAQALGKTKIKGYYQKPEIGIGIERHIYGHDKPYQTLILSDGIVEGVRATERWIHLAEYDLKDKRIVDIGCSSGMDGNMAMICGAKSYDGYDSDRVALDYGITVGRNWGVSSEFHFQDINESQQVRDADTMFLFSIAQRISLEAIFNTVMNARPSTIYVETHSAGEDEASINLIGRLTGLLNKPNYEFGRLAEYRSSNDNDTIKRTLWKGVV